MLFCTVLLFLFSANLFPSRLFPLEVSAMYYPRAILQPLNEGSESKDSSDNVRGLLVVRQECPTGSPDCATSTIITTSGTIIEYTPTPSPPPITSGTIIEYTPTPTPPPESSGTIIEVGPSTDYVSPPPTTDTPTDTPTDIPSTPTLTTTPTNAPPTSVLTTTTTRRPTNSTSTSRPTSTGSSQGSGNTSSALSIAVDVLLTLFAGVGVFAFLF